MTTQEILDAIKYNLQVRNANINTATGSLVNDIFYSIAAEIKKLYDNIDYVEDLTKLNLNNTSITSDDINAIAANYGLTRKVATASNGIVVFYRKSNLSSGSTIVIPVGTQISVNTTPEILFSTTQNITITDTQLLAYWSITNERYEIPVAATSSTTGTANNVGSHTITTMKSSIANVDGVDNNLAFYGGDDEETDQELVDRIIIKLSGNNAGTKNGYKSLVDAQSGVISSYIATADDAFMTRDADFGGKVDIYIQGNDLTTATDSITYAGEAYHILIYQPVRTINAVIGTVGANLTYTFLPTTDYILTEDTTSTYEHSYQAQDRLTWTTTGIKPDISGAFTVNYTYNALASTIQNVIYDDSNHIVNADILVKEATPIEVDISAVIQVKTGYNKSTVTTTVETALAAALNAYTVGEDVEQSDIIAIIVNTTGVDRVNLPLQTFCRTGDDTVENIISITGIEYAVAGTISIN